MRYILYTSISLWDKHNRTDKLYCKFVAEVSVDTRDESDGECEWNLLHSHTSNVLLFETNCIVLHSFTKYLDGLTDGSGEVEGIGTSPTAASTDLSLLESLAAAFRFFAGGSVLLARLCFLRSKSPFRAFCSVDGVYDALPLHWRWLLLSLGAGLFAQKHVFLHQLWKPRSCLTLKQLWHVA